MSSELLADAPRARDIRGPSALGGGWRRFFHLTWLIAVTDYRLTPGRYFVHCYAARSREQGDIALHQVRLFDFVVYGPQRWKGSVTVDSDVQATLEP